MMTAAIILALLAFGLWLLLQQIARESEAEEQEERERSSQNGHSI